jgi:hypothetical protein
MKIITFLYIIIPYSLKENMNGSTVIPQIFKKILHIQNVTEPDCALLSRCSVRGCLQKELKRMDRR